MRPFTRSQFQRTWNVYRRLGPFELYRILDGVAVGPNDSTLQMLNAVLRYKPLPDLEFIYFRQDQVPRLSRKRRLLQFLFPTIPVFASAKRLGEPNIILFADWHYEIDDQSNGWNSYISQLEAFVELTPWENRVNKLIWRGGANGGFYTPENWHTIPRGKLVYLSRNGSSNCLDASFTNFYPWAVSDEEYFKSSIGTARYMSPQEQAHFKLQIDIDGFTATFTSLQWKLLSGNLVLKQTSPNIMWFHHGLIPGEHFVPLRSDLSDVRSKVEWVFENESTVKTIAERGRQFALNNLVPKHIVEYCHRVLKQYASFRR